LIRPDVNISYKKAGRIFFLPAFLLKHRNDQVR